MGLGVFGCTTEDGGRCKLLAVGGYAAGEARNPRAPPPCTAVPSVCLLPRAPGPALLSHRSAAARRTTPAHQPTLPHAQPVGPRRTRPGGFTDAAFVFDTKMDEWTYAAPLPAPRFVPSVL